MQKFILALFAAIILSLAGGSAASAAVTAATPGVVSLQHRAKGDIVHWKDWASYAKANGLATSARKANFYLDCSGPVPPPSDCSNVVYSPGSSTYFHMGNAQYFLGYTADWCGAWYCRTYGLATNYIGTSYNVRLAGSGYSSRSSSSVVAPYVNWYQPGLRKYCWFGTTVVGSDISASTPYSLNYACGPY